MTAQAMDSATPDRMTLRQQGSAFWQGRAPRERQALAAVFACVLLALVWLVLVQPAWRTLRETPERLDQLDRQLQQIQATAADVRTLRAVPPVSAMQANAALKAATDRLGERARMSVQGDRATVSFTAITPDALRAWLNEVRSAARARPVEASFSRAAEGYSGTLILTLGGVQ